MQATLSTCPGAAPQQEYINQPTVEQSSPAVEEETPLEFYAEMTVYAVESVSGAKVELGYGHAGEWLPVEFGEGPSLFCHRNQLELWLTDPDTLESYDGPLDLEFAKHCVAQTIKRCFDLSTEFIEGRRPVPEHAVEVWPVNNCIWRVEPGERIPPGITHIRPVGPYHWQEVAKIRSFTE